MLTPLLAARKDGTLETFDTLFKAVIEPQPPSPSESKAWTIGERLKALKKKATASQRLHIEMEAAQAYKEQHGKPPAKEQLKGKYEDVYPATDLGLIDEAIERVLQRYAKSS